MDRLELTQALRACTDRHYNCCQSVLIPFCPETGLEEETAFRLGDPFGGGMHMGSVCGALTGGYMVLGLLGYDKGAVLALTEHFRAKNAHIDCKDLLSANAALGREKKPHCDDLVYQVVDYLDRLLRETPPSR